MLSKIWSIVKIKTGGVKCKQKYKKNTKIYWNSCAGYGSVAVAFSGGVDSALLLYAAREALGKEQVLAVTVLTPSYPAHEAKDAARLLQQLQVPHIEVGVDQLAVPGFAENGPERCYYCKLALFETVQEMAALHHCAYVADGANVDDEGDYRPGMKADGGTWYPKPLQAGGAY